MRRFDQYPPESEEETQLHAFFQNLKNGRFTTTRCEGCGKVWWPPRTICPNCITSNLEWVELPKNGRLKLYTVCQREKGVEPVVLGIVEIGGLHIPSKINASIEEIEEGMELFLEIENLEDGRVIYAFSKQE